MFGLPNELHVTIKITSHARGASTCGMRRCARCARVMQLCCAPLFSNLMNCINNAINPLRPLALKRMDSLLSTEHGETDSLS